MSDIKFEIKKHVLDLSDMNDKGWKKELNLVSWNDRDAKYDIRDWNEDHSKMGKGITLTSEELKNICSLDITDI